MANRSARRGDYRVLLRIEDEEHTIVIVAVSHRARTSTAPAHAITLVVDAGPGDSPTACSCSNSMATLIPLPAGCRIIEWAGTAVSHLRGGSENRTVVQLMASPSRRAAVEKVARIRPCLDLVLDTPVAFGGVQSLMSSAGIAIV